MAGMASHSREGKEDVTVNWLRSDDQIAMEMTIKWRSVLGQQVRTVEVFGTEPIR